MSRKHYLMLFGCLAFAVLLFVAQFFLVRQQTVCADNLVAAGEDNLLVNLVAEEFRVSTRDMTRYARAYCTTKNYLFINHYLMTEAWREGDAPRPKTLDVRIAERFPHTDRISQFELFRRFVLGEKELVYLSNAFKSLEQSRKIEHQAIDSIRFDKIQTGVGEPQVGESVADFAHRILYDDEYQRCLDEIQDEEELFRLAHDANYQLHISHYRSHFEFLTKAIFGIQIITIVFLVAVTIFVAIIFARTMHERTRALLDATPLACRLIDENFHIIECNEQALEMLGVSTSQEFDERFFELFPDQQQDGAGSRAAAEQHWRTAFDEGYSQFEWQYKLFDGTFLPAEVTLVRVPYANSVAVAAFSRDLRMQKKLQAEIETLHQRTQMMIDMTPIGCMVWSEERNLLDCNREVLRMFGAANKEEFYRRFLETSPEYQPGGRRSRDLVEEALTRVFNSFAGFERFEWMHKTLTSEPMPVEMTLVRAEWGGKKAICAYARDLRELKKTQQALESERNELRIARDAAQESARAKGEFLANMSHEIRTPMNAILGMTYLCLQTDVTPKQKDYLVKTQTATTNLLGIINDILDFSKIEAGKLTIEMIPFSLRDVVKDVVDVINFKAADKGLKLSSKIAENTHNYLLGDALRLRQVLLNLTSNAVKFTESGEVSLLVEVAPHELDAKTPNPLSTTLVISVQDTGIGMTTEQLARLFQSFSQADSSTTRRYGGTGLGLAISKNLVELMDGTLTVSSQLGKGSVFTCTIPFSKATSTGQPLPKIDLTRHRILLVDDDEATRELVSHQVRALKIPIDSVNSGQTALVRLGEACHARNPYTILLIDWKMPGMSGLELVQHIRKSELETVPHQIVMISAYSEKELVRDAEALGVGAVLTKPISNAALEDALVAAGVRLYTQEAQRKESEKQPRNLTGTRILLAEDNRINQMVTEELLRLEGIHVTIANDGLEAVERVKEQDFSLILMDIQMPNMDGLEATRAIRKLDKPGVKDVPILAMTAHAMSGDRENSLEAGMNDHITKPIDPVRLHAALEMWIR